MTPDSFSDGGKFLDTNHATEHAQRLIDEGADILDIGGESSRPGASPVSVQEEMDRVLPVIEKMKGKVRWISIDSRNAATMRAAIHTGANIVNDISGLSHDPESIYLIAQNKVHVFLMHMQGDPQTMQKNPQYNNVVNDVFESLKAKIELCRTHRIDPGMIVADPGIGFGKTLEHNLLLLRNIKKFHALNVPILLGTSRKSFIGHVSENEAADDRLGGSISSALWGLSQNVQIFRVHDVKETRQAFKIYEAISSAG